jgi:hypothetical protein
VHRYVIACEVTRPKGATAVADTIRRLATEWEHPLDGLWVVETTFKAQDIQAALLEHMTPADRLLVVEAGPDKAAYNVMASAGRKVSSLGAVMKLTKMPGMNRMLTAIFSRSGKKSRHLTAATSENLKSA